MYKLVAIDLDGTLLNSNGVVSEKNKKALSDFEKIGGTVTLVSGRGERNMRELVEVLGLKSVYHVAMFGNRIFSKEKNYPTSFTFSKNVYSKIISILEDYSLYYLVCSGDTIYYKRYKAYYLYEWLTHGISNKVYCKNDIAAIEDAYRVGIYITDRDLYEEVYLKLKHIEDIVLYREFPNIEVIHKQATKAHGLSVVADFLKIDKDDILSIGDAPIDVELIEYAGLGVAMKNATADLKRAADVIIDKSNDESGVAYVIDKYILRREECENV